MDRIFTSGTIICLIDIEKFEIKWYIADDAINSFDPILRLFSSCFGHVLYAVFKLSQHHNLNMINAVSSFHVKYRLRSSSLKRTSYYKHIFCFDSIPTTQIRVCR